MIFHNLIPHEPTLDLFQLQFLIVVQSFLEVETAASISLLLIFILRAGLASWVQLHKA